MARAYSDDLRRKFLEAHAAGRGTLRELAERFNVSQSWAFKLSACYARTGTMARAAQRRHGPVSKVDTHLLRRLIVQKPDIVLRELRQELAKRGVPVSLARIAGVLKQMGLRLKKSRSTPPSAIRKKTANAARPSSKSSARRRPKT